MKKLSSILILIFSITCILANPTLSKKAQISLLTYAKTNEIHAMYGHTALRVKDQSNGFDLIFNYGTFDFNSDAFIYRFVKGYTDYILSVSNFENLSIECFMRNMSVREQILNLDSCEKQKVFDFLVYNADPKNRVYRYNFIYDNCATRPRIVIEQNVSGNVVYKDTVPTKTFRHLINECTQPKPWLAFGINLVLGKPLDQKATYKEQMFLPYYMEDAYNRAVVIDSTGIEHKLVLSDTLLIDAKPVVEKPSPFWLTPLFVSMSLFVIIFLISYLGFKKGRFFKGVDFALFFIYGLAGSLIFFVSFFSSHPAVKPNYNLFVLHPAHLLMAFSCLIPALKPKLKIYHLTNSVILAFFMILVWFLQQQIPVELLYLTFALFFRSLFHSLNGLRNK